MKHWIWLALVSVAVAGALTGAWRVWQYWRLYSVYASLIESHDPSVPMRPTARHLKAIRKLRFAWDPMVENGGPIVDPSRPYGSAEIEGSLGSIIGTRDAVAIAAFHVEVPGALAWALENGELLEGRYHLARLDNATLEREMMRGTERLSKVQVTELQSEIPRLDPDGTFMFTAAHRLLLKHLRFEWPHHALRARYSSRNGHIVPIVNFKRPFGDMTSFDIDMARILGLPRPQHGAIFDPVLWRLYMEMWPALQVFVEHAQIPPIEPTSSP